MARYETLSIQDLQQLQTRFIAALHNPRTANRDKVETYLADVERALRIATGMAYQSGTLAHRVQELTAKGPAQLASIHAMRTGKATPQTAHDRERLAWSHWS